MTGVCFILQHVNLVNEQKKELIICSSGNFLKMGRENIIVLNNSLLSADENEVLTI